MKINIIKKIILLTIISLFIINVINISIVQAADLSNVISSAENFLDKGSAKLNTTAMQSVSNTFYKVLLTIGIIVAIIIAMIIGIQYMVASADEKAKVKESILPFIVGCIVVFGAFGIWSIFVNVGNDMEGTTSGGCSHNYKETVVKPTCTSGGYTEYVCIYCGDNYVGSYTTGSHNYKKTVIPPTASEEGYTMHKCENCGDEYVSDVVPHL